jgi:phosphatidylserine decarboxylase
MSLISARSRIIGSRTPVDALFFKSTLAQRPVVFTSYRPQSLHQPAHRRLFSQKSQQRPRFSSRLRTALNDSKIQWFHIPVGLGIGFLGLVQFYRVSKRESEKQEFDGQDAEGKPKKRERIRPEGPW